ncbi:MAG: hypothetical protein ACTSRG_19215 [Candidatus Helarchaeota archaeon]
MNPLFIFASTITTVSFGILIVFACSFFSLNFSSLVHGTYGENKKYFIGTSISYFFGISLFNAILYYLMHPPYNYRLSGAYDFTSLLFAVIHLATAFGIGILIAKVEGFFI